MNAEYAAKVRERIVARIAIDDNDCWVFQGSLLRNGYGQLFDGESRSALAHRTSYRAFVGPIPAGYQIDHLCKVRACINPSHLEAVPARVNNARSDSPTAINARKTHCIHGHALGADSVRQKTRPGTRDCQECRAVRNKARSRKVVTA